MDITRRRLLLGAGTGALAAPGLAGLTLGERAIETPLVRGGGDSLWTDEIESSPAMEALDGDRSVDLAIVGGGYTGLSCAFYAKKMRPDWKVAVLESHRVGAGASSRNSGAVYAKYVGIDDTGMARRGLDRFRDFLDEQEIECDFSPAATLIVHRTDTAARKARENLEPGARWIPAEQLRDQAGTHYYAGAVDSPGYYKIHPSKLVAGHARAALQQGVEIFERSPVQNIASGRPALLTTPTGKVTAKNVLIATNAYTPRLGLLEYKMFPLHQYTFATRKLSAGEIQQLGLHRWDLRFEPNLLPITFSLTPSGHFFLRVVLGYASHDATEWRDTHYAQNLVRTMFEQRYPQIANIGLDHPWHGVTGHTVLFRQIAGPVGDGNIHISAAYNGLGIMPGHYTGYLSACRITGQEHQDLNFLRGVSGQVPMPGDFYRSMIFKPFMRFAQPV